jgi:repressor LexA
MSITERRQQILEWLAKFQARKGFPPSVREIGEALGLASAGSLHKHLQALEKGGYLERSPGKKRTWSVTNKAWDLIGRPTPPSIPLVGQIAAGAPILAVQNREEELPVDPALFGSDEVFALRVKGDSMIDAHIQDGDLAIIRPQEDAEDGQIVAVQVEDLEPEATLKVLRRSNGGIELHPANSRYAPLIFKDAQRSKVTILGRLVGVIRPRA